MSEGWRRRVNIALLGISLAFVLLPLLPNNDVINSDWPAFATGARLIVSEPSHLYDIASQQKVERDVTGGRVLVSLGIHGILPFLAPPWVALLAVPFDLLGPNIGGRAWILFGLACLGVGLYLATRGRSPTAILPAFASAPTALMMLNAQIDGTVALGIGAALALWSRPFLAGLALGLTLVKPQLVLPLGFGLILTRRWRALAGWITAGAVLAAATLALNPHWVFDWLGQTRSTIQSGAREIDLAHFAVFLPSGLQAAALAGLSLVALCAVLALAARRRSDVSQAGAILVVGGVLASPHALPADLVLVALGLAVRGGASWLDWLALSAVALAAALTPDPVPAAIGVLLMLGLTLRVSYARPAPELASAR